MSAADETLIARARKARVDSMQRHVLVCTAGDCPSGEAVATAMKHGVALAGARDRIGVLETLCTSICKGDGDTVVVYPEGTWYGSVDVELAERIVAEHLLDGQEISDEVFLRNPLGDPQPR